VDPGTGLPYNTAQLAGWATDQLRAVSRCAGTWTRWYWELKGHMAGLTADSDDDQLRAAAPSIPVFALEPPD
jgi:hypothetical protein